MNELVPLPRAAALMLWTSAYLHGDIGPDDAVDVAFGSGHRQRLVDGHDLFDWMTDLKRLPLAQAQLALPLPGRIAGLIGPPPAIIAAIEAEQAVVVTAAGLAQHTLVPRFGGAGGDGSRGVVVTWELIPGTGANVAPRASSSSAREEFLHALQRAARSSTHLDLVPEEPVPESTLPPSWTAVSLPVHLDQAQRHLLLLSARTLLLVRAELQDTTPHATGLADTAARGQLLHELEDAAREALVEIVSRAVEVQLQ